jgi:hypothetical protein
MATGKTSGLGDNFYIGGYDLSGDVASVDTLTGGPSTLEATPINKSAETRLFGLRDGAISFTTYFESSAGVTSPGVPTSTTPLVSAYNFPVFVTIVGGTMTNVTVNGSTVGTGAGTYTVPALGTITLTYSVAPTWTWCSLGTEHQALKTPISNADVIASYFRGTALGSPAACMNSKQTDYDPTRDATGGLTLKVDLVADAYGLEWGIQATAGLRTDTAATVGAAYDQGSAIPTTAYGAQAYLQLTNLVGTSVDVQIQHSTTSGGTYTTLIDFGAQTTFPYAARAFVSNTTTVNEFLKITTVGTFSLATFSVVFVRNQIAGQVF